MQCGPRGRRRARQCGTPAWRTRAEGLCGASFVGSSLAFRVWHSDLSEWPGVGSDRTAAKTPAGRSGPGTATQTREAAAGPRPGRAGRPDAQAAPLCVYYSPCSVCFFTKTLTVRAVSHCLKITSLHPHALAGINLVLTCGSSAFQKANKSRGDRDLRIPFVPFLVPGGPGAGSAPKPFGCSPLPGDVSSSRRPGSRFQNPPPLHGKHPWDFRHKSRTRRRPVCDTLLSPEALGGPQPGSGGWGSASAVPVAPRALPRQGPVGRIQPRC